MINNDETMINIQKIEKDIFVLNHIIENINKLNSNNLVVDSMDNLCRFHLKILEKDLANERMKWTMERTQ